MCVEEDEVIDGVCVGDEDEVENVVISVGERSGVEEELR